MANTFQLKSATGIVISTIQANLEGTATTADKWSTARTLSLTGSVTGAASIDGSGDVTLTTTTNHDHDSSYVPIRNAYNKQGIGTNWCVMYTNVACCYCSSIYQAGVKITIPGSRTKWVMLYMEISIRTCSPQSGGTLLFTGYHNNGVSNIWQDSTAVFDGKDLAPSNMTVWVDNTQTENDVIYILGSTAYATFSINRIMLGDSVGTVMGLADTTIEGLTAAPDTSTLTSIQVLKSLYEGQAAAVNHGNHVPATETADNARYLRNDNTWHTLTPADIGAATQEQFANLDDIVYYLSDDLQGLQAWRARHPEPMNFRVGDVPSNANTEANYGDYIRVYWDSNDPLADTSQISQSVKLPEAQTLAVSTTATAEDSDVDVKYGERVKISIAGGNAVSFQIPAAQTLSSLGAVTYDWD